MGGVGRALSAELDIIIAQTDQGRRYRGGRGGSSPPTFIGGGAEPPHQISVVTSYLAHKSKYLVWCGLASRLGATLIWLHGSPSRERRLRNLLY